MGSPARSMRLVFVNQVHPASGLVAGLRLWRFAEELAKRGHRILFLTERLSEDSSPAQANWRAILKKHNWSKPLIVACGMDSQGSRFRTNSRNREFNPFAKLLTAGSLVCYGGVFWRWRKAAEWYYSTIRNEFRPHLTYGTFGTLDTLNITRDLAHVCAVPWVMDVKDPFQQFVPRIIWPIVRRRYRDAAVVTYNSVFQRNANSSVIGREGIVVYSGADISVRADDDTGTPRVADPVFLLIGSIRSDDHTFCLLRAFKEFALACKCQHGVTPVLRYFGVDWERVRQLLTVLDAPPFIEARPQIPRMELLELCRRSVSNCYLTSRQTYHHKLFELLATGRPVIAYPWEHEESIEAAKQVGAILHVCRTATELIQAWESSMFVGTLPDVSAMEVLLGWPKFAVELERVFTDVLQGDIA